MLILIVQKYGLQLNIKQYSSSCAVWKQFDSCVLMFHTAPRAPDVRSIHTAVTQKLTGKTWHLHHFGYHDLRAKTTQNI